MRALSVRQPYATMLVLGLKSSEYRTFPTKVRGKVLVYASSYDPGRQADLEEEITRLMAEVLELDGEETASLRREVQENISARRAFVGLVEIVDCREDEEEEGVWEWVIGESFPFSHPLYPAEPIRPSQVFWNVPDDLLVRIGERVLPLKQVIEEEFRLLEEEEE